MALAAGAAFIAATPNASAAAPSGQTLDRVLAESGKTTTFARDTAWTFSKLKGDHHLAADKDGGVSIEDGGGEKLLTMSPKPVKDAEGHLHKVTWTVKGNTLYQHVDTPNATLKGVVAPTVTAYGFWDWAKCVGKKSLDTAELGGVAGCIGDLETGCAPGAAVGGFGGAVAGMVQGAHKC
ncbi:hypothetical protein K2224_39055 (plasmid) [Streptomyces sp. BHT-5-2]|uniref:hypothetical protein n=1 Tax=unclassified Streptomyces TaxID=2593676 RepID=UPI001C8DE1A3|nr:hypothetical protein [Streptomyces sp. BHT-5-2]QZL08984.1 hypothetical protein K2224_39055 [Streptomyces sp. BHT-5-2]